MLLEVLESGLPLGFQVLLPHPRDDPRASAVAAIGGAAIGHEKEDAVWITVNETRHGHVGVLATGVRHFLGGVPAFLDARNDLAADRAVGIVTVDEIEKVRRDGHGQLGAGEEDTSAFDVGEIEVEFQFGEGIDAVPQLPTVVVPIYHCIVRPVAGSMRNEGGVKISGSHVSCGVTSWPASGFSQPRMLAGSLD